MQRLKIKRTIARAAMLLMMLLTSATAWADGDFVDNGNGSYTIHNADGWSQFASSVYDGTSYSGKTVNWMPTSKSPEWLVPAIKTLPAPSMDRATR
jgi:hypothetical protein